LRRRGGLADGFGQAGCAFTGNVHVAFVLHHAVQPAAETASGATRALVFVGDLQEQQRIIHAELVVAHRAFQN